MDISELCCFVVGLCRLLAISVGLRVYGCIYLGGCLAWLLLLFAISGDSDGGAATSSKSDFEMPTSSDRKNVSSQRRALQQSSVVFLTLLAKLLERVGGVG